MADSIPHRAAVYPPAPRYEDLFQEAVYPDGPYDRGDADDSLDNDD